MLLKSGTIDNGRKPGRLCETGCQSKTLQTGRLNLCGVNHKLVDRARLIGGVLGATQTPVFFVAPLDKYQKAYSPFAVNHKSCICQIQNTKGKRQTHPSVPLSFLLLAHFHLSAVLGFGFLTRNSVPKRAAFVNSFLSPTADPGSNSTLDKYNFSVLLGSCQSQILHLSNWGEV